MSRLYKRLEISLFSLYNKDGDFMNVLEVNVLVLAYLGDTIYENYVRHFLINKEIGNVNDLQTESIKYVSAKAQAKFLEELMNDNFFLEDEISVIKRARNYKSNSHPKNTDIITYKHATSLEAVIGYLDMINKKDRIDLIMNRILKED